MTTRSKLTYVYDPLCGWCYGFSPVIQQVKNHYQKQLEVQVLSGGMAIGDRAAPIGGMYGYIKQAYHVVEERTGVTFGPGFVEVLEEGTYQYDSEPPCIALTVFKDLSDQHPIDIAHAIQRTLFYDGEDLNEVSTYLPLATHFGVDTDEFAQAFQDETYRQRTYQEFQQAQQLGVQGFPTLLYQDEQQQGAIARGFMPYQEITKILDSLTAVHG